MLLSSVSCRNSRKVNVNVHAKLLTPFFNAYTLKSLSQFDRIDRVYDIK